MESKKSKHLRLLRFARKDKGAVLLVVLFVVMAITILSLGFLSRSSVELACGENMILRAQMDYLVESGLEHAKGLILNPQDIDSEYWTGADGLQIVGGSNDYYNVSVEPNTYGSGPTLWCNYDISCDAYRLRSGEEIGHSSIKAELRLDPCIAYWAGAGTTISQRITINGDVYCNGTLTNEGVINGDVFANSLSGSIAGQQKAVGDLLLDWPRVTVEDFTSKYPVQPIGAGLSGETLGPYNPVRVCHRTGDLELAGGVQIEGMLVVEGDLTIRGVGNVITAAKNLPALLVTGDVIIEGGGKLDVYGLAVVNGEVQISADDSGVSIVGGLFTDDGICETTVDSSGHDNTGRLYNGPTWQPFGGQTGGALQFDGVDDYVQTSNDITKLQLTGDYTLSIWVKADSTQNNWAGILSKCNTSGSTNHWTLQFDISNPKKLIIYHPTGSWYTGIQLSDVAGGWHHISVVRSGNTMTSYLDGNEVHSNTWSNNPGSGDGHLNIGADRTASTNYVYKGLIDDVRIYNCALDANDIYPPTDGLAGIVGHWKLDDEGSGDITMIAAPSRTAIVVWSQAGVVEKWGQAAGAFFRSIRRN